MFLIPVVVLVFLACILHTEKALLFFGALAPLSINYDNLGGGLGMSLPTEPVYILLFLLLLFHVLKNGSIDKAIFKLVGS